MQWHIFFNILFCNTVYFGAATNITHCSLNDAMHSVYQKVIQHTLEKKLLKYECKKKQKNKKQREEKANYDECLFAKRGEGNISIVRWALLYPLKFIYNFDNVRVIYCWCLLLIFTSDKIVWQHAPPIYILATARANWLKRVGIISAIMMGNARACNFVWTPSVLGNHC